jgi:hypothetical protein
MSANGRRPSGIESLAWAGLFAVGFALMSWMDPSWGPGELWWWLFRLPVLPLDLALGGYRFMLAEAVRERGGHNFHSEWIFLSLCYALAPALYRSAADVARRRVDRRTWATLGLLVALLAAQSAFAEGWGHPSRRAARLAPSSVPVEG